MQTELLSSIASVKFQFQYSKYWRPLHIIYGNHPKYFLNYVQNKINLANYSRLPEVQALG